MQTTRYNEKNYQLIQNNDRTDKDDRKVMVIVKRMVVMLMVVTLIIMEVYRIDTNSDTIEFIAEND